MTIFKSQKICKREIFLLRATFKTTYSVVRSTLLLEHYLGENIIQNLHAYKDIGPALHHQEVDPPNWPRQRNPKGLLYLFMEEPISFFWALSLLIYAPWSNAPQELLLLQEELFCYRRWKYFQPTRFHMKKKDGSALSKHIDLTTHQALEFRSREASCVP